MLLRFGVANHRSIRDYQELHLSAASRIERKGLTIPVPILKEAAVPVVALYGGNATGKSNLIDALHKMRRIIVDSHKSWDPTDRIPRTPFLLADTDSAEPTRFDCTFAVGEMASTEDQSLKESAGVYEYGFEYVDREVRREWLHRIVRNERQSTQRLFERNTNEGKVHMDFGNQLRGQNRTIADLTRLNSLFLSAAAQNNHPLLTDLYRYFAEQWTVVLHADAMNDAMAAERLSDYQHMEHLLTLVRQADLGVVDIDVEDEKIQGKEAEFARDLVGVLAKYSDQESEHDRIDEVSLTDEFLHRKRLRFVHSAVGDHTAAFRYSMESKGTRVLMSLLVPALEVLFRGALLVIDELDTSLHPDLTRAFVALFTKEHSNPHGAQLVFSTHDVALLGSGVLHQDEIWMTDKRLEGASRFTPLTEFKLRSRDDFEKAYRLGRFGGIPSGDDFFISLREEKVSPQP